MSSSPETHSARHPTFKQYVAVAIILFVITLVEFLLIVPKGWQGTGAVIAPLAILSAIKFGIVIMFYMHLKFDHKLLSYLFIGGLILAFSVGMALVGLFGSFQPQPRAFAAANAVPYAGHEAAGDGGVVDTPKQPEADQPPQRPAPTPPVSGSAGGPDLVVQGEAVFTGGSCAGCHTIDGKTSGLVGPDLTHLGTAAVDRKGDLSAREYIEESIRDPEAFVAPGVERAIQGVMTSGLVASLSDADIEALVEFLLAQK